MSSQERDAQPQLSEELVELQRMLASLEPAPSRVDRERMMFDAGAANGCARALANREEVDAAPAGGIGRAATECATSGDLASRAARSGLGARTGLRPWPLATAAALFLACLFGSLYAVERHRAPVTVRQVVYVERDRAEPGNIAAASPALSSLPVAAVSAQPVARRAAFYPGLAAQVPAHYPKYLALRQLILARGVESLPQRDDDDDAGPASEPVAQPATIRQLMKEFLGPPAV